jgi:hypothetical protein
MAIGRTVAVGTGIGSVAAVAIYVAMTASAGQWPTGAGAVSPAVARVAPSVPSFTTTMPAPCIAPAVLVAGTCVTHVPGRATSLPAPAGPDLDLDAPGSSLPLDIPASGSGPAVSVREHASGDDDGDAEHDDDVRGQQPSATTPSTPPPTAATFPTPTPTGPTTPSG